MTAMYHLEGDLKGHSKGDFRGDFKQDLKGHLLSSSGSGQVIRADVIDLTG